MKNYLFLLFTILLLVCISCKQHQKSNEEYQKEVAQEITQLNKLWLKAWENENLDSVMLFLDDGFLNMFSFDTVAWDKERCRNGFPEVFNNYSIEGVEYKILEIIADQNYAFETQLFKQKWITNDKQDTTYFNMRIMIVFKKQADGSRKLFRNFGQQ